MTTNIPGAIQESLFKFREKYPDPSRVCFIMMAFREREEYAVIEKAIKDTLADFDLIGIRADDNEYHSDLYWNVATYMHGCGFGVAVFEHIEVEYLNPNVALEVGYMQALNKPVCLLKEKKIPKLNADNLGKLYRDFNLSNPETISRKLSQWLDEVKPYSFYPVTSETLKELAQAGEKLWKSEFTPGRPTEVRAWVDRVLEKTRDIPELNDDDRFQGALLALKDRTDARYYGRYTPEWQPFFEQILSDLKNYQERQKHRREKQEALEKLGEMGIPYTEEEFLRRIKAADEDVAILFLTAGIRPEAEDMISGKAIYKATRNRMIKTVSIMFEKNIKLSYEEKRNMMLLAVQVKIPEILEMIIEDGANVNDLDKSSNTTALFFAGQYGSLECAKILLDHGADVHLGQSPFANLNQDKNPELVKLLREAGAPLPPKPPQSR